MSDPGLTLLGLIKCFIRFVIERRRGRVKLVLSGNDTHEDAGLDTIDTWTAFTAVQRLFSAPEPLLPEALEVELLEPGMPSYPHPPYRALQDGLPRNNSDCVLIFVTPSRKEFEAQAAYMDRFQACLTQLPIQFFPYSPAFAAANYGPVRAPGDDVKIYGNGIHACVYRNELEWGFVVWLLQPTSQEEQEQAQLSKEGRCFEFGYFGVEEIVAWAHAVAGDRAVTASCAKDITGAVRLIFVGTEEEFATTNAALAKISFKILGQFGPDRALEGAVAKAACSAVFQKMRVGSPPFPVAGDCANIERTTTNQCTIKYHERRGYERSLKRLVRSLIGRGLRVTVRGVPADDLSVQRSVPGVLTFETDETPHPQQRDSDEFVVQIVHSETPVKRYASASLGHPVHSPPRKPSVQALTDLPSKYVPLYDITCAEIRDDTSDRVVGFLVSVLNPITETTDLPVLERLALCICQTRGAAYNMIVSARFEPKLIQVAPNEEETFTLCIINLHEHLNAPIPNSPVRLPPAHVGTNSLTVYFEKEWRFSESEKDCLQQVLAAECFDYVPYTFQAPDRPNDAAVARKGSGGVRAHASASSMGSGTGWVRWMRPRLG